MNNTLGLYIPNSDYTFECSYTKCIDEFMFIITKGNEIITYKNQEDSSKNINLKKKYILLTHPQSREDIFDIFIMNKTPTLLDLSSRFIVTITNNLIFHFWDLKDGLCINKLNLSNYKLREDTLLKAINIDDKSILILLNGKSFVVDINGLVIVEEENFGFEIKKIYKVKENKFFLLSTTDETHFLEIKNLNTQNRRDDTTDICNEVSYRIYKHTFNITKVFNQDTIHSLISNQEFVFFNYNSQLKMSFLDSVEELSELASLNTEHKSKVYYLGRIENKDQDLLIVIYKDLWCETFTYDKIHRDIVRKEKFAIMIEDEYFNLKFCILDQFLVGYVDSQIFIFDLNKLTLQGEKYVDRSIELGSIFGKNRKEIFFTNYFKENFEPYYKNLLNNLATNNVKLAKDYLKQQDEDHDENKSQDKTIKITSSAFLCSHHYESIYYLIGTSNGKIAIIDIFFDEKLNLNPVILIDYHTTAITSLHIYENRLLIAASSDGMITFTDISLEKITKIFDKEKEEFSTKNQDKNFENPESDTSNLESKDRRRSFEVSPHQNYYYSKKKSLLGKEISDMILVDEDFKNRSSDASNEEKYRVMNLLPIQTYKNYNKLRRILFITQLDSSHNLDENFRPIQKNFLGFELENNSVIIIDMKTLSIIYSYNIYSEKNKISAIYLNSSEKCLIFYQDNNIIKIVNYMTKTADRIVTDANKIYLILHVEEKLKMYFQNGGDKIITNDFKTRYHRAKEEEKDEKKDRDRDLNNILYNTIGKTINYSHHEEKPTKHVDLNSESNISLEYIYQALTDPNEKKIFIQKYLFKAYNIKKMHMNMTYNKFESVWLRKVEAYIIDQIFSILNANWMLDPIKKINIMNLLFNPLTHYKLFNRFDYETQGIEENIMSIGNQLNEYLSINIEDFCLFIERFVNKVHHHNNKRNSFYNFISLFRIWNLSIDQDLNVYNYLRIYQPIFEFSFILRGYDCAMSIILNEEVEVRENLAGHFNFTMKYLNSSECTKKIMKEERFCNKKYIINRQQGYLVNFKNFVVSSNLSHLINLTYFSILTAALGFHESNEICRLMTSDKLLLRSLSGQKFISFTNISAINKFMYDNGDNMTIANKDLILVDYLAMKYSNLTELKKNEHCGHHFIESVSTIVSYLSMVYAYLLDFDNLQEISVNFYKFTKDKNLENQKLAFISDFELSLINILVIYNSIAEPKDKLDEATLIKITHLLILLVFKILNPSFSHFHNPNYSKTAVELLSKSTEIMEIIYKENSGNYAKFLIDFYSSIKLPIDLEGLFKKYEIGNSVIIKSENNLNFLKIMLAKLIKNYSKTNVSYILKIIVEEFKKKTSDYDYFSYLLEILWIIFREKNYKHVNFLPPLINLIINAMSPQNKEMKTICLENAKKVLSCLLPNYPMIDFHQNRQRLAVGANDGKIYIYDLASCNMWKNLNAHTNEITALKFDFTGNILISYSASEGSVKFWKIGLTNFFSNFFSMKDGYYKSDKFDVIESDLKNEDKINIAKFQLMPKNDNKVVLIREDKSVKVLNL